MGIATTMATPVLGLLKLTKDYIGILAPVGLFAAVLLFFMSSQQASDEPPELPETIPFVSNAYQYMTDLKSFTNRVSKAIRATNIVQLHIGTVRIYLATGAKNLEGIFRKSTSVSSDGFIIMILQHMHWFTKEDLQKFINDKSGRLPKPLPGLEHLRPDQRYFSSMHGILHDHLLPTEPTVHLAKVYNRSFSTALEKQPLGEWGTTRLYEFLQLEMGTSAAITLCGQRWLTVAPDLIDKFWKFDSIALQLLQGMPKWIDPKPTRIRNELNLMAQKVLTDQFSSFDWDSPAADADWEPTFGSRFMRAQAKWGMDAGLALQSRAGYFVVYLFGMNSNTIPVTAWAMFEIIKDPQLLQAVRAEAQTALVIDPETRNSSFDIEKLLSLPLLQSIYIETLRLNVCINVTREVIEPTVLNGYKLKKGALLQAPTNLANYDEQIWNKNGHAASEFWAERHINEVQKVDQDTGETMTVKEFSIAARPSEFFPYGGGLSMCPGRFFAKREIILTIAMIVSRFDMEFVEWTKMDGSTSERPPQQDQKYFGAAAVPPDRDMTLRLKRLW